MKRAGHVPYRWCSTLFVAVLLFSCLPHRASAQFVPTWQRHYLRGIRLERDGRYGAALEAFSFARTLQPHARKDVLFPKGQRLAYDPYYHMAFCLAHSGGSPLLIKKLAQRSAQDKVTPRSQLEALRDYVLSHSLAAPWAPGWRPSGGHRLRRVTPAPVRSPVPARLELVAAPSGVIVELDGGVRKTGRTSLTVRPGRHHLRVLSGRHVLYDRSIDAKPGETFAIVVPTAAARPRTTPTVAPSPTPALVPGSTTTRVSLHGARHTGGVVTPARPGHAMAWGAFVLAILLVLSLGALIAWRWKNQRRDPAAQPTQRLASPPGGLAGAAFGPYEIEAKLGSGGMATTYRARRRSDGKKVALKIPHDTCLEDETFRKRFLREGALGAQLHHPNLVRIIEAGEEHGIPYIAMELVDGVSLRDLLSVTGQLPLDRALDLTRQVAEALDYAHSKGVIHRDLKPENLMVLGDGHLMVMDFGIARVEGSTGLTRSSVVMGTPAYAAPESLAREPVDHRSDLYALGIILFEMLEGEGPFPGAHPLEQLQAHLKGDLPNRSELVRPVPDEVWHLINRLVARKPDDRFPSAEALLVELGSILRGLEEGRTARE